MTAIRHANPSVAPGDVVKAMTKRRYLDRECRTDKDLRAFHFMVEDMKLTLDEGWAGPPKRGLAGTPEQRRREALRRLGEVHGRDYLAEKDGSD